MIVLYRILTYILLPFAVFFGLLAIIAFFVALGNPALFLGVFMLVAFSIYSFCSFRFLHQGILTGRPLKTKLRDWIKVNAYVALPFAVLNFMQSFAVINNPELLSEGVKEMLEMQQRMGVPAQAAAPYNQILMASLYIMLVVAVVLLLHILLSFSLLKKYQHLFVISKTE
jgi:hypothetical protein